MPFYFVCKIILYILTHLIKDKADNMDEDDINNRISNSLTLNVTVKTVKNPDNEDK